MLTVETIGRIRREHFLKGKTIKEIARDLLSSNAVKPAREQLTLIRIFEELRGRGYDGGYDAVRRYARRWAKEHGQATAAANVPLSFAPGEAYQFDWSHEVVLLNGTTVIVKVAHVRLCHSRMLFVRAYPRETQEMVFDAHDRAFASHGKPASSRAGDCSYRARLPKRPCSRSSATNANPGKFVWPVMPASSCAARMIVSLCTLKQIPSRNRNQINDLITSVCVGKPWGSNCWWNRLQCSVSLPGL
jgi:hypothetical protein